jgi:hypothetical protein
VTRSKWLSAPIYLKNLSPQRHGGRKAPRIPESSLDEFIENREAEIIEKFAFLRIIHILISSI